MDSVFSSLEKKILAVFTIDKAADFVKNVVNIRGQFQQLEVAFTTLLKSEEKANKLMAEAVDLAAKTPFDLQGVASGARQLLAYGFEAENVTDVMRRLGDVAAGLGLPLQRLTYLYGTTRVQGRLYARDMLQFTNSGIPLLDELAKMYGKTTAEINEMVSAGKIGFSDVEKVIKKMTDAGGQFDNLMAKQSTTITGQMSNIKDAIDVMFNEIGKSSEGFINTALSGVSSLVENYEKIGKAIAILIATYGAEKAAVAAVSVAKAAATMITNGYTAAEVRQYYALLASEKAQKLLNATLLKNPYVLAAAALTAVTMAIIKHVKANNEMSKAIGETTAKIQEETDELDRLFAVAKNEKASREDRKKAIDTINARYGDYLDNLLTEKDSVEKLTGAYKNLSAAITEKYLEQMREQTVGARQTSYNEAESDLWGEVKKIVGASGLSSGRQGAMTREMQVWISKFSKYNNAGETYNALMEIYGKYGGKDMTSRQRGNLYGKVWDFKDTQYQLSLANKEFNEFASGYNTVSKQLQEDSKAETTFTTIADEIKAAREELDKLKKEEKDLLAGKRPAGADSTFSFESALAENAKAQKAAQGKIDTLTSTSSKETAKFKDAMDKYTKQLDEFDRQMTRKAVQTQWDIRNAEIDAMEDGYTKEMEKVKQEHIEKLERLSWNYEDELEKIEEQERELYKQKHDGSDAGFKFDAENNVRAIALRKQYYSEVDAEEVDFLARSGKLEDDHSKLMLQHLNEYLKQYGNLEARKLAISKDYDERIRKARKEGDEGLAKSLEAQKNSEIFALEKEYSGLYALIFADAQNLTNSQLEKAIEATQEEIKKASESGDIQKLTELYERLRGQLEVNSSRTGGWGFFGVINGFKDMKKAADDYEKAVKAGDKEGAFNALSNQQNADNAISKGLDEVIDTFDKLGSTMSSFGGTIGEIGEGLSNLASNLSGVYSAIKSGDKGSIISAAITGVLSLATTIGNQIQENKKYQEEWNRTIEQCAHEYQMLQLEQYEYQQQNIFGVENPYKKAIDNAELYRQSMFALVDMQNKLAQGQVQTGTKKVVDWGNVGSGVGAGAAAGAAIGTAIGGWAMGIGTVIGTAIGALVGGLTAAFAAKKVVPVFEGLLTQYGYLYDEKTYELNPQILADYDKLDEDTKQIVDNWNEIKDKALEAEQQMRDTFSDMAGDIGTQLSDALVEAFRNKALYDAIGDFHDTMTGTIEDIIEQLVFATTFGDMFDELEQRMFDSFGVNGDGSIVDDLAWMENEYQKRLSQYDEGMMQAQETMERLGYNLWASDEKERTGYTKNSLGASQESVDESNGRLTALQGKAEDIYTEQKAQTGIMSDLRAQSSSILEEVMGIHDDTTAIRSAVGELHNIAKEIRSGVGTITDRGVKML